MTQSKDLSLLSVPAFWPMAMAATMLEEGTELYAKNLKFVEEEIKIHGELRPTLATPNQVRLDLVESRCCCRLLPMSQYVCGS